MTIRQADAEIDVAVEAEAWVTLRELIEAVGPPLAVPETTGSEQLAAMCERLGTWLELDRPILDARLAEGDRLVIGSFADLRTALERRGETPPGSVEIAIRGGPRAGERVTIGPGDHVLGRDARSAEIVVAADPSMSGRHLRLNVGSGRVSVEDLDSTNGTHVDGTSIPQRQLVPLHPGSLVEAGRTSFSWRPSGDDAAVRRSVDVDGRVTVDRPPRVRRPWQPTVIALPSPPEEARRQRIPILASLVPLVAGIALFVLTQQPAMLLVALLGPLVAVASRVEELGFGVRDFRRRSKEFRDRLPAVETELESALVEETAARRAEAPDAGVLLLRPQEPSPDLWLRRPTDPDAMDVRIGSADQAARTVVTFPLGGSHDLRAEAEAMIARHAQVPSVPVIVPLARWRSVGLVGRAERVDGLGHWIALQAAILHAPSELRICAAVGPSRLHAWEWLKWLPHARPDDGPGGRPALTVGADSGTELLEALLAEASAAPRGSVGRWTVVVLDGGVTLDPRLVARLLQLPPEEQVAVVWLADDARTLPNGIASIVRLDPAIARLELVEVATGYTITDATADGVPLVVAEDAARSLAPLRDPTQNVAGSSSIPRAVSLLAATGVPLTAETIESAWANPVPATVIGMAGDGPYVIDLARDGPHALVGGTTGSGKSELLQALVAGLALANPPSRVSFLLIDYKGGAAFRESVSLPHTAGFVTDLDEHLARRAVVSLDAEIRRREALLGSIGAKNLETALARDPAAAPARLVIVIDEFATLAREVPEFIQGVVDVAQRGRTLGVHLILATQRPAGAVTREIWANTNLRIALRVTDPADSTDVVGIPDAAAIAHERPGRAIGRVGQAAPVEFQAAFVGARMETDAAPPISVQRFTFAGVDATLARPRFASPSSAASDDVDSPRSAPGDHAGRAPAVTELEAIVTAVTAVAERLRIPHSPSPWLPALLETVPLRSVPEPPSGTTELAVIGLVDDPARQRQDALIVDLDRDGAMLVYGAGGSGRTTVLRTLAASLARRSSPADLHLYGLDFGAGGLRMLEDLPHCGGMVPGSDEERVSRLLGMIRDELEGRQRRFAERRVHDIQEFRASLPAGESLPRIVLFIDGYAAFAATYERIQLGELVELLPRLATDGRPVGINLFLTADRRGNIPSRLAGVVQRRLVLRLSDESEYGQLGLDRRTYADVRFPPGRGLTEAGLETQVAIAGDDPSPAGQREAMGEIAERARLDAPGIAAPAVGVLPANVSAASLAPAARPGVAVLGIADHNLGPAGVSLDDGHFLVAGPLRSGRSTALMAIAVSLAATTPGISLHLLAPRRTPLSGLGDWASIAEGPDACDALVERLAREAANTADDRVVLVIDDGEELFESASAATLATLARRGRDSGMRIVAAVELRSALRAFGGWLAEVRKDRHGLLLQPGQEMAGELLGATLPRAAAGRPTPPGRGYLVVRGGVELVQVAQS